MLGEPKDVRAEYARKIREIADTIENGPQQPKGVMLHVFWPNDQGVTSLAKTEPGFAVLFAAGFYLKKANAFTMEAEES